jgi:hypothetical protein
MRFPVKDNEREPSHFLGLSFEGLQSILGPMAGRSTRCPLHSSTTETESMEKFRPKVFRMTGRESGHQLQINRGN